MPIISRPTVFFRRYRFLLVLSTPTASASIAPSQKPKEDTYGLTQILSDPFRPDRIWLASGHALGRKALIDLMREALAAPKRKPTISELDAMIAAGGEPKLLPNGELPGAEIEVRMLDREGTSTRSIKIHFTDVAWLPFDLDAMADENATEQVALLGCTLTGPVDHIAERP